jgi:hypothetical protein
MDEGLSPQIPPGVESAIGRFIANFSLLEEWLRGVTVEIPNISAPAGEIIVSELSFRALLNVFGSIVHEYCDNPEILDRTDKTIQDIHEINNFRNQLVHSLWLGSDDSRRFAVRSKMRANRKKGFRNKFEKLKKEDLIEKCDEVAVLTKKVQDIYQMINTGHPAARDGS